MQQITILITDPHSPALSDVTGLLSDADVNIIDIDADSFKATGIITLRAEPHENAISVLSKAGYKIYSDDVLLLEVDDKPGELARLTHRFKEAEVDIRSMRIVQRKSASCILAVVADRSSACEAILKSYALK